MITVAVIAPVVDLCRAFVRNRGPEDQPGRTNTRHLEPTADAWRYSHDKRGAGQASPSISPAAKDH